MPRSLSTRNFELTIRLALSARQVAIRLRSPNAAEAASLRRSVSQRMSSHNCSWSHR